ncbi:MAG: hypothetical protein LBV60_23630 [Streptomyces sp.]|nr:hypothetical protein [Streptomyces sp.]
MAQRGAVLAAGTGIALGLVGTAPAYAANDWDDYSDLVTRMPDDIPSRSDILQYKGGLVTYKIGWNGTKVVWLDVSATDERADGYNIVVQVRYQSYRNGVWSGWQYRQPATAKDMSKSTVYKIYKNTVPIKNLHVRGCYAEGSVIVNCDNTWH